MSQSRPSSEAGRGWVRPRPDSRLAGIHRTYPPDIERGTRNVSPINIERVASALSLRMSELFQAVEG